MRSYDFYMIVFIIHIYIYMWVSIVQACTTQGLAVSMCRDGEKERETRLDRPDCVRQRGVNHICACVPVATAQHSSFGQQLACAFGPCCK